MNRVNVIQSLINKIGATRYLEIGLGSGEHWKSVNCKYKVSVDPNKNKNEMRATYVMESDEFFLHNKGTFDVIFIDGLHWEKQVYKDVINSLGVLNKNGFIICHDINPKVESLQFYPYDVKCRGKWTGDCWKAWVRLRREHNDLNMFVVNSDFGCGVISRGHQNLLLDKLELTWKNLVLNRKQWLNLISVEEFGLLL